MYRDFLLNQLTSQEKNCTIWGFRTLKSGEKSHIYINLKKFN